VFQPLLQFQQGVAATQLQFPQGVSVAEVARHTSINDCFIVYRNETLGQTLVYDMSAWVSVHPGGPGPIQNFCGRADGGFSEAYDDQHEDQDIAASNARLLGQLAA
jgi:cytochrome b involved in lipid metabolism